MKTTDFYLIRAISNLHVGSGEGDFSVIDKRVQRDPVTQLPTIHASGIKGALREAMQTQAGKDSDPTVNEVFGTPPGERDEVKQGKYRFFDGQLLALPARSSKDFFYLVSCPGLLTAAKQRIAQLNGAHPLLPMFDELFKLKGKFLGKKWSELRLEDTILKKEDHSDYQHKKLEAIFGKRFAIIPNAEFAKIAEELPIVARNYLNNGISDNLWYEEYVPREARFLTMVTREDSSTDHLGDYLKANNDLAQLGANATVGYGLCEFKKL